MKLNLTSDDRTSIVKLHKHCKERKYADRLKAILLLDDWISCIEVGRMLLLDDDTIRTYRTKFLNEGIDNLLTDNNKETTTNLHQIN